MSQRTVTFSNQEKTLNINTIQRLNHLKILLDNDIISKDDFNDRKSQIINKPSNVTSILDRTCDTTTQKLVTGFVHVNKHLIQHNMLNVVPPEIMQLCCVYCFVPQKSMVIPHPPPDWRKIHTETAVRWEYSYNSDKWIQKNCFIQLDEIPFAQGRRYVFYLKDQNNQLYVAKICPIGSSDIRIYFNDVQRQAIATHLCNTKNGYNAHNPPNRVHFLESYVLHLSSGSRYGSSYCYVERYYKQNRYQNHVRETECAFAHFTYEETKHKFLVSNMQHHNGDHFRDPVIVLPKSIPFNNFLQTHRCNLICQFLKLSTLGYQFIKRYSMDVVSEKTPILTNDDHEKTICQCKIL